MATIALRRPSFGFLKKKSFLVSLGVSIIIMLLATGGFFAYQYYQLKNTVQDPTRANMQEVEYVISKVGKLVELPKGEMPLLATVDDVNKLKDRAFFKNAQNGDKALFYSKAQRAFLYRPSTNKIIEIGPYIVPSVTPSALNEASSAATLGESTKVVSISLFNGTPVSGLAKKTEDTLLSKLQNVQVVEKKDAKKKDYIKNLIFDIKGDQSPMVGQIQSVLGGEIISAMPEGEATPSGQILVILGSGK